MQSAAMQEPAGGDDDDDDGGRAACSLYIRASTVPLYLYLEYIYI